MEAKEEKEAKEETPSVFQKKYDELVDNYKMKYGEDVYDQKRRILQFYE